jgi:hypothetical protein
VADQAALDPLLVCAYLVVAGLPVFAMLAELEPRPLEGAFPPAPAPTLTLAGVRSEQYQTQLVQWFEGSLGLRALSVRLGGTSLAWKVQDLRGVYYEAIPRRMRQQSSRTTEV